MTEPNDLKGVIAPLLTPFNHDGTIAEDIYINHARRLLADGCVGLAPFGTTGEALSVGNNERMQLLEALVDSGIAPSKLIPGTGLTNLIDTVALTKHTVKLGCAGAMTLPPFYFKDISENGLFTYFSKLIELVSDDQLHLYLYHIPQVAGVGIPPNVVARLHTAFPDQVVGIKDSSGDWDNTRALLDIENLLVYPGSELPIVEAIQLGAPGCISATANLNANAIAEVISLMHTGQTELALAKHTQVTNFRLTLQDYAPIPAQKRIMALWTGDERWANVRPPLDIMTAEKGQLLVDILAKKYLLTADSLTSQKEPA